MTNGDPQPKEVVEGTSTEVKRKKYLSRKLIAFVVNDVILIACYILTLLISPSLLAPSVIISFMALIVLNGITYIGGKALETWAKSKWFRAELLNK